MNSKNKNTNLVNALVSNTEGEIFDLEGYAAVGMAGQQLVPLTCENTIKMPFGGELMFLPDRIPLLYNMNEERIELIDTNPYFPEEPIFPVAAFNSPGYVNSYACAYEEDDDADFLPLFSYGAVGWHDESFRSSVILVDSERRQDLRLMNPEKVKSGVKEIRKKMPSNRLEKHLEKCALEYGCPAAKNFFLGRYEAPLPTSVSCNANCLGCISLQKEKRVSVCQERISFTPKPEEIAEIALEHISKVKNSVVSFGQGCEGDPIFAAHVIEPAIKIIRSQTPDGTINMNTNASKPDVIETLFNAGLDTIRVSINSVREECYEAYFRPNGYTISDVKKTIDTANRMGRLVSINYLNCPGFTDSPEEIDALFNFLENHTISLIQWRNLNFDPARYYKIMCDVSANTTPIGLKKVLELIRKSFPDVKHGYFNPPKEKMI